MELGQAGSLIGDDQIYNVVGHEKNYRWLSIDACTSALAEGFSEKTSYDKTYD
jgi:hypothetical protein